MLLEITFYLLLNVTFALTPSQTGWGANDNALAVNSSVAGTTSSNTSDANEPGRQFSPCWGPKPGNVPR